MDRFMTSKNINNQVLLCGNPDDENRLESQLKYILETPEVAILQDHLCGQIRLSTTIICKDENQNNRRVDSRISSISLRPSCDMVRRCDKSHTSACEHCDNQHANLLLGAPANTSKLRQYLDNQINKYRVISPDFAATRLYVEKGLPYIRYRCPMLGYLEMIFPIRFENYVIATLILG